MKRDEAKALLLAHNKETFLIQHAETVAAVLEYFAKELGYADEADYWYTVGLLHDLDYEQYPEEHCHKTAEILRAHAFLEEFIRAIMSHGYGIVTDVKPEHTMEKVLYATDELTGLIWAAALMRPSKSTQDMELKSLKKKFKDKRFAAGCSRDVITNGAGMLGWELDELLERTLVAMQKLGY